MAEPDRACSRPSSAAAIDYLWSSRPFLHFTSIGEAVLFACYIAAWLGFSCRPHPPIESCVGTETCGAWQNRPPADRMSRAADGRAGTGAHARAAIEAAVQEPLHALEAEPRHGADAE